MSKTVLVFITILALFLAGFAYFGGLWQNREKIHHLRLEMEKMKHMRDSLATVVAYRDSLQTGIRRQIQSHQSEAEVLRQAVSRLEEARMADQLSVRKLRRPDHLTARLKETFPEMAGSDWGVTDIYNDKFQLAIQYLVVPFHFSETFIIDHQNALSWRAQKHQLQRADSLGQQVVVLQDSIINLEKMNRQAYQKGFERAYAKYDSLNGAYIQDLYKARMWQFGGMAIGGAAGFLAGRATK